MSADGGPSRSPVGRQGSTARRVAQQALHSFDRLGYIGAGSGDEDERSLSGRKLRTARGRELQERRTATSTRVPITRSHSATSTGRTLKHRSNSTTTSATWRAARQLQRPVRSVTVRLGKSDMKDERSRARRPRIKTFYLHTDGREDQFGEPVAPWPGRESDKDRTWAIRGPRDMRSSRSRQFSDTTR